MLIGTDVTYWRGLDLKLNGSATNAEPASWKDPGFDDSGWALVKFTNASPSQVLINGASIVVDAGSAGFGWTGEGIWIARRSFDLAALPVADCTLRFNCDNLAMGIWLNGTLIGDTPDGSWLTVSEFTIDPSLFVVGENVLAFKIKNTLPVPAGSNVQAALEFPDLVTAASDGWDAYAAAAPNGAILATIQASADPIVGATKREIRVELDGPGMGSLKINRYSPVATEAILADGNLVKCRFPWRSDYDFGFLLEKGDFDLLSKDEKGGEEFSFGGRGMLAYLDRGVMEAAAYTTGFDLVSKLVEVWHTNHVPKPTGVAYRPSDPGFVLVISATTRRIYRVRQSDRKVVATSPALWSGSDNFAVGLTADPTDPDILWALEAPATLGGSGDTKIRRVSIAGGIASAAVTNTYSLGSPVQLTDIRASTGYLWTSRYDNGKIQRRTRAAPATVDQQWTVTYNGNPQTHANGIAINENGTGSSIAMWFGGTASGGVKRALIADLSDPSTVVATINTKNIAAFGGDWSLESGASFLYMVSYTLGLVWKFQIDASVPHDPLDGIWRLDEGSPGAILWRVIQEALHAARPQHPYPDLTYDFTATADSAADTWDPHDGTQEFDAKVTESILRVALRLLSYGLVIGMSPRLLLSGFNRATFGTDRTGATFGGGVVRFEKGVNIEPELGRQTRERQQHSHMLAVGKGGLYARAIENDLGYVREGGITTDQEDTTALAGTAQATLDDERIRQERIRFAVPIGNDPGAGKYLPWTHYAVGDLVTLHTGAGEHDFTNETFLLYAFTLSEGVAGTWEQAILELGAATIAEKDTGTGGTGSGGGGGGTGGTGGGGGGTITSSPITMEGLDDTGTTITTAIGSKIRAVGIQVYQESAGVIRAIVTAASRLLTLDDVNADDIADGQTIVWDAAAGEFVPGDAAGVLLEEVDLDPSIDAIEIEVPNGALEDLGGGRGHLHLARTRGGPGDELLVDAAVGAAKTLDLSAGNAFDWTLTDDCTVTKVNPPDTDELDQWLITVRQGAGAPHTLDLGSDVWWLDEDGLPTTTAPALHPLEGAVDVILLSTILGGTAYGAELRASPTAPTPPTTFGTPAFVLGTVAAGGSIDEAVRRDATIVAFDATVPTSSAVADAAAAGSAAVAARRDHRHGREAFAAPGNSAVGDAASSGAATTIPRSDHRHGREAFGSPVAVGAANADGSATTPPRSDHVHAAAPGADDHIHIVNEKLTGDGATTAFLLANEAIPNTIGAYVAGDRTDVTLGGMNDQVTFAVAPGVGAAIRIDYIPLQT